MGDDARKRKLPSLRDECRPRCWALTIGRAEFRMRMYIVYYRFKNPGDKKHGPVRQFRIFANDGEEAQRLLGQYANYPNLEVVRVKAVG